MRSYSWRALSASALADSRLARAWAISSGRLPLWKRSTMCCWAATWVLGSGRPAASRRLVSSSGQHLAGAHAVAFLDQHGRDPLVVVKREHCLPQVHIAVKHQFLGRRIAVREPVHAHAAAAAPATASNSTIHTVRRMGHLPGWSTWTPLYADCVGGLSNSNLNFIFDRTRRRWLRLASRPARPCRGLGGEKLGSESMLLV